MIDDTEDKPLVSVVIPAYNAGAYLKLAVKSVVMQDYKNIEIIIVDDASTDRCVDCTMAFNTKLIRFNKNRGECCASGTGFAAAKGKYVCRLSADDEFVSPWHISKQVEAMERYNLDWCYNNISFVGESVKTAVLSPTAFLSPPVRYAAVVFRLLDNYVLKFPYICYLIAGLRNPVNSSALMFRNASYRRCLDWDASGLRSCCDGSLLANVYLNKLKGRAINHPGVLYRIHPGQATGKEKTNRDFLAMRRKIYEVAMRPEHPFWVRYIAGMIRSRLE